MSVRQERAVLVSVALPNRPWVGTDPLDELSGLADDGGGRDRRRPTPKAPTDPPGHLHRQGQGRGTAPSSSKPADADVVIFDNDLSPAQVRNLEKATGRQGARPQRVDPRHLRHAGPGRTKPGCRSSWRSSNTRCPGCKQMWTHLSRQNGGGIGLRGPGETQLEVDRRLVGSRIRDLKAPARRGAGPQATRGRQPAARSIPSRWSATRTPARAR